MKPSRDDAGEDADETGDDRHHPASAIARAGSPADSGSTTAAMIAASEESGPSTRMRLGPKMA